MLAIGKENRNDPCYRYKMNPIDIRQTDRGKNSKTIILNLEKIANQLYKRPEYLIKYLGYSCAAEAGIDSKSQEYYIKGTFTHDTLSGFVDKFIDEYVICPACNKPETSLKTKDDFIKIKCYVCGANFKMVDSKMNKVIAKYPQNASKMYNAYERRMASIAMAAESGGTESPGGVEADIGDNSDDWVGGTTTEAVKARAASLSTAARSLIQDVDIDTI